MALPFAVHPLGTQDRTGFDCGEPALDAYLAIQAGQDMKRRVAACFVAVETATGRVAGFYTLSAGHVLLHGLPDDWRRKLPRYPDVPAVRLGRLAVDRRYHRNGLAGAMLANAVARALRSDVAAHMMVVDAKGESAAAFWRHHGFRPDPADPLRLYAPVMSLARGLGLA